MSLTVPADHAQLSPGRRCLGLASRRGHGAVFRLNGTLVLPERFRFGGVVVVARMQSRT